MFIIFGKGSDIITYSVYLFLLETSSTRIWSEPPVLLSRKSQHVINETHFRIKYPLDYISWNIRLLAAGYVISHTIDDASYASHLLHRIVLYKGIAVSVISYPKNTNLTNYQTKHTLFPMVRSLTFQSIATS